MEMTRKEKVAGIDSDPVNRGSAPDHSGQMIVSCGIREALG